MLYIHAPFVVFFMRRSLGERTLQDLKKYALLVECNLDIRIMQAVMRQKDARFTIDGIRSGLRMDGYLLMQIKQKGC